MRIPPEVSSGQAISAKEYNALIRCVQSLQLTGGPGIAVNQSLSGTTVRLTKQITAKSVAGGDSYTPPFSCAIASGKVTVERGYVNGLVPTVNGVALDAATTPKLTCYAGANFVYLKTAGIIDTTTGVETVSRAVVEIAQTAPDDTATAYAWTAYQILTQFTYDAENPPASIPQFVQVNLKVANFGRYNAYFA